MVNNFIHKKIKIGRKHVDAFLIKLQAKNFITLVGKNGYIMCGYLNLKIANKFKDVAIKVVGISTIEEMLKAKMHSCSNAAKKLGINKYRSVKDILRIIA
ncbi:MAG: DUF1805 domain-containing protein [Candidatus Omnitrophota bacterium]